jgi:predicted dehydrogenase
MLGPNPARIAVIGCGSWSLNAHLPSLTANPDAEVVAVVDPREDALRDVTERFGVAASYPDAGPMFDEFEPDGVVIAVPHVHHYPIARAALEHGAHVLVEKPMVLDPAHGRELVALARERGRELLVGYPWHYNVQARAVRKMVADGRIGRIEFVSCLFGSTVRDLYRGHGKAYDEYFGFLGPQDETFSDPTLAGGGQGQTQVTHSAALLFFLTGLRPVTVTALTEAFELRVDLADAAAVRFEGGAIGTVASTGSIPVGHPEQLEYRIFGKDGYVSYDVMAGRATFRGENGSIEALPELELEQRYPHWAPAQNLVDCVLGRGGNESPAEIGQTTVEFLDAMYRSAAAGGAPVEP